MEKMLDHYKGKEQALVKHKLLEAYLEKLFMIIGRYEKTICFVDCYAGPWEEKSEELLDTSIGISLKIMRNCQKSLKDVFQKYVKFRAVYVEKNKESYNKLVNFLDKQEDANIETKAFNGDFISLQNDVLDWCGYDDFVFFFIDPKGWKGMEASSLQPILNRDRAEYLINFMYKFVNRVTSQEDFIEHMKILFGQIPNAAGKNPAEREEYFLRMYRNQLVEAQSHKKGRQFSTHIKILEPCHDRTRYDLVYLTGHPLGMKAFMEASEKAEWLQKNIRAQAKQDKRIEESGQQELFSARIHKNKELPTDLSKIKNYWLKKLTIQPMRFGILELAIMLEDTGWFISDIQKAFGLLLKEGKVKNLDDTNGKRWTNFIHFDKNERLTKL